MLGCNAQHPGAYHDLVEIDAVPSYVKLWVQGEVKDEGDGMVNLKRCKLCEGKFAFMTLNGMTLSTGTAGVEATIKAYREKHPKQKAPNHWNVVENTTSGSIR